MKNIALVALGTALGLVASSVRRRRRPKPAKAPPATTEPNWIVPQESGAV